MQIFVDLHFLLKLIIFYEHKPVDIDQIKTFYFQKNFKDGSNTKAQMEERIIETFLVGLRKDHDNVYAIE